MTTFSRSASRVLLIDDDRSVVRLLTRSLAGAGYSQVMGLSDPAQVLPQLESHAPDLIVLDLNMPGTDGFQLLAQIGERLPPETFLPVLVLSGLQDLTAKEKAFGAGAQGYLTKPVDLGEFLLHVDSLLETRFLSRRLQKAKEAMESVVGRQAEELDKSRAVWRQVTAELSETEFKFRTVTDFAQDWEFWLGLDRKFIWVSPFVQQITGYSAGEFLADPDLFMAIVHPEDRPPVAAHLADPGAGSPCLDFRIVTRSGEIRWVAHCCTEITDGDGRSLGRRGTNRDITDRRAADELLRLTQFSVDHVADSVFWLDDEGNILFASEAACGVLGYSREELLGMTIYRVDPTLYRERYERDWLLIQAEGTTRFEALHRTKGGRDFPVEVTLNHVVFEGKEYNCVFARDITERRNTEKRLEESLLRLRETQATIIQVLSSITELRDPYTAGHQQRVAEICVAIASRLGLSPDRVEGLEVAALLHDVGKVSIPLEVLSLPGRFSKLQRMLVEGHVAAGYEILRPIFFPWSVADIVHQHHERLDGSGYPSRLKGEQIMLEARILGVADTFEAMTTHRPYRGALEPSTALEELRAGRGTLFDPDVVDACDDLVHEGAISPRVEPDLRALSFMA